MQKKILITIILFFLILLIGWIGFSFQHKSARLSVWSPDKLHVVASIYPIAEFARAVGGNTVEVVTVTPEGTEPHEYEPTAEQIGILYKSDVFLYNGGGIDAWATRIASDVLKKQIVINELGSVSDVTVTNRHIWLDPVLAEQEVLSIANIFSERDPKNRESYQRNFEEYKMKLRLLDEAYRNGLSSCRTRTIIASHAAFDYLAKRYDFSVIAIAGLSPEGEPSAGRLAEIVKIAKQDELAYIYFETLASPKLSDTIAREIGAKTLVLNPLEGIATEDQSVGKNYLTIMQENLENLKIGMLCQ